MTEFSFLAELFFEGRPHFEANLFELLGNGSLKLFSLHVLEVNCRSDIRMDFFFIKVFNIFSSLSLALCWLLTSCDLFGTDTHTKAIPLVVTEVMMWYL